MSQQIQTDNSCLEEKILLRLNSLEKIDKNTVNVLECFGGDGVIWSAVRERSSKKINTLRIDLKEDKKGVYLKGNNLKYLATLDLRTFDIIDLDAYGSPFPQLQIVFKRGYRGLVHCTFIQSGMGMINHELLEAVGYTKNMIKKCPTLFTKSGFETLCNYLHYNSVFKIQTVNIDRKHYFGSKRSDFQVIAKNILKYFQSEKPDSRLKRKIFPFGASEAGFFSDNVL